MVERDSRSSNVMPTKDLVGEVPFALLAVSTASRGTSALPPLHRVFPQGRLLHRALARVLGPRGGARTWVSSTPYVAPRLLKRRGKDSLDGLVRSECGRRDLPVVEVRIAACAEEELRSLRHYVLHDGKHEPPWPMR